jgi:nitrite reductase/ring-hydroxylating ferredoxin subunit
MQRLKRTIPRRSGFVFAGYFSVFRVKPFLVLHLMGKPVAVFRRPDGTFFSREMACTHQGADLTQGEIEDGVVTCPRHGRRYDLETGACLNRDSPPLREHAVRLKDNAVLVALSPKPDDHRPRSPMGAVDARSTGLA